MSLRRERGVGLLEVLITLLVVSLGLMGIASLFARGQLMADESYQRFQALSIGHELVERLTANRAEAALGASSHYVTPTSGGSMMGASAPTGYVNCGAATCTSSQVATYDLTNFHNALVGTQKQTGSTNIGALILARGCVEFVGTAGNTTDDPPRYRVSVTWQGRQATSALPNTVSSCASSVYNDETLRRIVSLEVLVQ